jgi:hypothetical protein
MTIAPWIAIVLLTNAGLQSVDVSQVSQIPMLSREACNHFAEETAKIATQQFSVFCVSTETGEIFSRPGEKKK